MNEPIIRMDRLSYVKLYYKPATDAGQAKHEFTLGIGPCGRYVTRLILDIYPEGYVVTQESYPDAKPKAFRELKNREVKQFYYPMQSIVGRVTTKHA